MSESAFVSDGFDTQATIARVAGLIPQVTLTYRPATYREQQQFFAESGQPDAAKKEKAVVSLIAKHVSDWSIDNAVLKSPEKLAKLKPLLINKLVDLITGYAGSEQEAADQKN